MQLTINGQEHQFIDIKTFREAHHLPESFGMGLFETKDYVDLANIEKAGGAMNQLREQVLDSVPEQLVIPQLMDCLTDLSEQFDKQLVGINPQVNPKQVEIDYAVSGFHDVCQAIGFEIIRAHMQKLPMPSFHSVYMTWLNNTVRLSFPPRTYQYHDTQWQVQVINTAYGRIGLYVTIDENEIICVQDTRYACPAEGYMFTLLNDIADKMTSALHL